MKRMHEIKYDGDSVSSIDGKSVGGGSGLQLAMIEIYDTDGEGSDSFVDRFFLPIGVKWNKIINSNLDTDTKLANVNGYLVYVDPESSDELPIYGDASIETTVPITDEVENKKYYITTA